MVSKAKGVNRNVSLISKQFSKIRTKPISPANNCNSQNERE